jgi:hypothetical protein
MSMPYSIQQNTAIMTRPEPGLVSIPRITTLLASLLVALGSGTNYVCYPCKNQIRLATDLISFNRYILVSEFHSNWGACPARTYCVIDVVNVLEPELASLFPVPFV